MKKMTWATGVVFIALLGGSGTAFAKHHPIFKNDNRENKVSCLVKGVQQIVKSKDACKDLNGTLVTSETSQEKAPGSQKKITMQKIQSE